MAPNALLVGSPTNKRRQIFFLNKTHPLLKKSANTFF